MQHIYFISYARNIFEEFSRFAHCHIQNLCNIFSIIMDSQSFLIESLASTNITNYLYTRQKVHLNFQYSPTFTILTTTTRTIKTKPSYLESLHTSLCCRSKNFTNKIISFGISNRIGSWCSSNWTLIDPNNFINIFQSFYSLVFTHCLFRMIELVGYCSIQNSIHQSRLARARYTCETNQSFERYLYIDIFQIMLFCADYFYFWGILINFFPINWHFNFFFSTQIFSSQ